MRESRGARSSPPVLGPPGRAQASRACLAALLAAGMLAGNVAAIDLAPPAYAAPRTQPTSSAAARPPSGPRLSISLAGADGGPPVPANFLGLSFEVREMPELGPLARNDVLTQLLRGIGPGLLRFGGVTADTQVAWSPGAPPPSWATTTLDGQVLVDAAALTRRAGWRALLTLNLGHFDPAAAADEAAEAVTQFGPTLLALELGNEPTGFSGYKIPLRSVPYTIRAYRAEIRRYRRAIESTVPGFPLAGPDSGTGAELFPWLRMEASSARPVLLTVHYYPQWCGDYPTIASLLSARLREREARNLHRLAVIQADTQIPLRIAETNNSSCGGEDGLSNTFAQALWASDYIARAMQAGLAGVNVHDIPYNPRGYSPIVADSWSGFVGGRLHAAPEYYALLLTHQFEGLSPVQVSAPPAPAGVSVFAFRGSSRSSTTSRPGRVVRVLVDDERPDGQRPLTVSLPIPAGYAGSAILRLAAPSRQATEGVTLGNRVVGSDGRWSPWRHLPRAQRVGGRLAFKTTPASADLVTLYLR